MEKLSRKTTNRSVLLNNLDFSGFSRSNNWIGYFERKDEHTPALIDEAIKLTYTFFKDYLDDFIMISALAYGQVNIIHPNKNLEICFNKAIKYNLLQVLTSEFDDYLIGNKDLLAKNLSISFDKRTFLLLSKLCMGHNYVIGEVCFFINYKLGIALYPHEDIGFGVISLDDNKSLAKSFLEYCRSSYKFNVFIDN